MQILRNILPKFSDELFLLNPPSKYSRGEPDCRGFISLSLLLLVQCLYLAEKYNSSEIFSLRTDPSAR